MVFDFLFGNKPERQQKTAEKYGNVLKNKVTTKEQRLEAIDVLSGIENPEIVIPQLMKRFEIVVDSGIQDKREKEMCLEQIKSFGEAAKPFLEKALTSAERVAWPIKLAEEIYPRELFVELLVRSLGREFMAFDNQANGRNIEIILALKECAGEQSEDIAQAVGGFLGTRDETLRMAALECLESQGDNCESARTMIMGLLKLTAHDDNSRFLGTVQTIIRKNGWQVDQTPSP